MGSSSSDEVPVLGRRRGREREELEEGPAWGRMPLPLQEQFFLEARREAELFKARLLKREEALKRLRGKIRTKPIPKDEAWKDWRVAVIDGSNSPSTSERLGLRCGTYCAGYIIFQGMDQVEEGYRTAHLSQDQLGSYEVAQKVLALLRLEMERSLALECLKEKDVDLVVIDGSFFGFRAGVHELLEEPLELSLDKEGRNLQLSYGKDLVRLIRDETMELLDGRKVVGIVKRTRSNAIDGWLLYHYRDEGSITDANDKYLLSRLLPPGHWFAFEWLLADPQKAYIEEPLRARQENAARFAVFSRLVEMYRKMKKERRFTSWEDALDNARRALNEAIKRTLDIDASQVLRTARYFVRPCQLAPFELEAPWDVEVEPLIAYLGNFYNPSTGMPWPLDLVDSAVSLPRGFNKEFVEEVEALLMKDPELVDKLALQQSFTYLNPQKEED